METLKFWAVFTIGVAAGATVALIYAPQTGKKTRNQLKRKLEDAGDYLKDASGNFGDYADKTIQRGKDKWDDVSDVASKVADKTIKHGKDKWDDVSDAASKVADQASKAVADRF